MYALLAPLFTWFLREVIAKFMIMLFVYVVLTQLLPIAMTMLSPSLGVGVLNSAFSYVTPGMWYFLDMARLDYGLPIAISAGVTLFTCRRIPFLNGR